MPGEVIEPAAIRNLPLNGRMLIDLALAVHREFELTERTNFQFRAEFFNALNHTNLGTPNRFVNTPQFGAITKRRLRVVRFN